MSDAGASDGQPKKRAPKVRGAKLPRGYTIRPQHDPDRRQHAGMEGRVLSDLSLQDLRELVAVQLNEGVDGVLNRYGLTRGEWVELCADPSWQTVMVHVAAATRVGAVNRFLLSLARLAPVLEDKMRDPQVTVNDLLMISDALTSLIVKIGGIEQKLGVTLEHAHAGPGALAPEQAPQALDSAELAKLQRLNRELSSLDLAGVDLSEVIALDKQRKAS